MTHRDLINVTVWGFIFNQLRKEKAGPAHPPRSHPPGALHRDARLGPACGTPLRFSMDRNSLPESSGKDYQENTLNNGNELWTALETSENTEHLSMTQNPSVPRG